MKTTENGVNTPFIISWPGHIPSNSNCDALIDFSDMLPTFAQLAGTSLEKEYEYDGVSFVEVLKNPLSPSLENGYCQWALILELVPVTE